VTSPPVSANQFCNQSPWTGSPGTFSATQVPEIDATSAAGGLALLAGGLIVLRGRKRQDVAA
jgi:LPXTG-motif cell wall-anchored protein